MIENRYRCNLCLKAIDSQICRPDCIGLTFDNSLPSCPVFLLTAQSSAEIHVCKSCLEAMGNSDFKDIYLSVK